MSEFNAVLFVSFLDVMGAGSYKISFSRSGSVRSYYILQWENAVAAGESLSYPGMKFHPIDSAPDFDDSRSGFLGGSYSIYFVSYTQRYEINFFDMNQEALNSLCDFLYGSGSGTSENLCIYVQAFATTDATSGSGRTPSNVMKAQMSNVYSYTGSPVIESLLERSSSGSGSPF